RPAQRWLRGRWPGPEHHDRRPPRPPPPNQPRSGRWQGESRPRHAARSRRACHKILGAGEQLLEQADGARVIALAQPKNGFAPHARIFVSARDLNQRGHPNVTRLLRQRKYSVLADVTVDVVVTAQTLEIHHAG